MVSKKTARAVSKVSSAAAPGQADATTTSFASQKSSILRSAFSPSEYQLALFASVIQGLDAPHLRIHDVKTGRLQGDHAVKPRESITSLDWGYYGHAHREPHTKNRKKKRKRSSGMNGVAEDDVEEEEGGNVVVAFGTSSSEVRMYSPAEDKVVGALSGVHDRGIRDFKFTAQRPGLEGWSIGADGKLVQWDLPKGRSIRVVSLPSTSVMTLSRPAPSNPPILCASQTPYVIDLEKDRSGSETEFSFSAMRNSVHTLMLSSVDSTSLSDQFLAADSDRYMNIFDTQKRKLLGSLVTDTGVECVSIHQSGHKGSEESNLPLLQRQVLAAVTDNGTVELFSGPFHHFRDPQLANAQGSSLKSRGKSRTRRADAVVRLVRPDKSRSPVPVISASFQGPDLVIAWVEGGANLLFHRLRWQEEDSDGLALRGDVEVVKSKVSSLPGSSMVNGVKDIGKTHVDETHAVVEQGGAAEGLVGGATQQDAILLSSDDDVADNEDDVSSQSENEEDAQPAKSSAKQTLSKKAANEDVEMADAASADEEGEEEQGEPSFGELLRANANANASEPIDVETVLAEGKGDAGAVVPATSSVKKHESTALDSAAASAPSGLTLATVLTQSLKTNDTALLESCFHTADMNVVRSTIQRIDSSLAATLLQKLAERLSTRPGRYGHLLVWVQWTVVAHGGAIAGRPEILKQMTSLFKVMDQRSSSLSSLLLLKGKLDMLDAQLGLRQGASQDRGGMNADDEDDVIYVEGQEDEVGEDEEEQPRVHKATGALDTELGGDDDEDMPLVVNGVASEEDEDEGDEDDDLVDDEAELSADDGEDVSEDEDEDEEEDDLDEVDESMEDFVADSAEEDGSDISVDAAAAAIPKPKGGSKFPNKKQKR